MPTYQHLKQIVTQLDKERLSAQSQGYSTITLTCDEVLKIIDTVSEAEQTIYKAFERK